MEKELDVILFDRVGKQLILTPSGLELVDYVRSMADAANRVSMSASGQSRQLDGEVCITATDIISVYLLPPIIEKIRSAYPGIVIEVIAADRITDLNRREADIAIRNLRPTHPDLIARKVGDLRARLYGTPDYLDQLGRPTTPEKLSKADITSFNRNQETAEVFQKFGLSVSQENFPVVSESVLVQWELIKRGMILGMMIESIGDEEPKVEQALPDADAIKFPIWLVAHHQLKSSQRIRVVYDLLADAFGLMR